MKNQLIDRLTRYTTIDTQSDPKSTTTPSTEKAMGFVTFIRKRITTIRIAN